MTSTAALALAPAERSFDAIVALPMAEVLRLSSDPRYVGLGIRWGSLARNRKAPWAIAIADAERTLTETEA